MKIHRLILAGLPAVMTAFLALSLPAGAKSPSRGKSTVTGQVNLNTASAAELRLLPRLRAQTAEAIVAYRAKHRFQSVREVMQVKGIGQASFVRLKPHLAVEGPNTIKRVPAPKGSAKKGSKATKGGKGAKAEKGAIGRGKAPKARKVEKDTVGKAEKGRRGGKGGKGARRVKTEAEKAEACRKVVTRAQACTAAGRTNPGCVIAGKKAAACQRAAKGTPGIRGASRPVGLSKDRAHSTAPKAKPGQS